MLKAAIILGVLCLFCRWALGRWPWEFLSSAPSRGAAIARAQRLLAVEPGAGRDEIIAAHRRLTARVHPDVGGSTAAMQEANAARDLLLAAISSAAGDDPPGTSRD